jgi:N-acetylglucosaminyldiphosphoundecaprenol N-acetyl-beta-D-mannosaminyltransferase
LFFLGASPGVGNALKAKAELLNPSINIKGVYCPPFAAKFEKEENDKMMAAINTVKPDIVLVSLTAPKQDIWISENLEYLDTKIAIGIGGAFEVTAGLINRAPLWMQKAGLEWFYRFTQEPKRMFKRYFIEAPVFIPLVILQKIKGSR